MYFYETAENVKKYDLIYILLTIELVNICKNERIQMSTLQHFLKGYYEEV